MFGEPVSSEKLREVLDRQVDREKASLTLKAEMESIKPGECLRYEAKPGLDSIAELSIRVFTSEIPGLELIKEGNDIYVYRAT